jgi:hypothetical protein
MKHVVEERKEAMAVSKDISIFSKEGDHESRYTAN